MAAVAAFIQKSLKEFHRKLNDVDQGKQSNIIMKKTATSQQEALDEANQQLHTAAISTTSTRGRKRADGCFPSRLAQMQGGGLLKERTGYEKASQPAASELGLLPSSSGLTVLGTWQKCG